MAKGEATELDFSQCINTARGLIIENGEASVSTLATRSQAWSIPTMTRRWQPFELPGAVSALTSNQIEKVKSDLRDKLGQIVELKDAIEDYPSAQKAIIQTEIEKLNGNIRELRLLLSKPAKATNSA